MKIFTKFIISFILLLSFAVNSQTTAITDSNFEQQLIDLSIDSNGLNGNILNSDAEAVTSLIITSTTITDFGGLEAFVNLITLDLGENQFNTAPLTTLTVLENLYFDKNDALNLVDLAQNSALKVLEIGSNINVGGEASITVLDLSQNINLEELKIEFLRNLTTFTLPITDTLRKLRLENSIHQHSIFHF